MIEARKRPRRLQGPSILMVSLPRIIWTGGRVMPSATASTADLALVKAGGRINDWSDDCRVAPKHQEGRGWTCSNGQADRDTRAQGGANSLRLSPTQRMVLEQIGA